ncbi:hypothetical protein OSB04_017953 [Centaurea solstitialis]|uniref:Retrotransposon gag domain-containing protein n=1 Tax=Centaurea solstitialis TaxID=347529 RepID=A0AA38TBG0_9ASTR|nr:hypothetical protein OSB04_017953 [Centaurea solstitialis]
MFPDDVFIGNDTEVIIFLRKRSSYLGRGIDIFYGIHLSDRDTISISPYSCLFIKEFMIRRSQAKKKLIFDPEIEATCRRQNAERLKKLKELRMADERTLKDFVQPRFSSTSSIAMPTSTAHNYEIKTSLINFVMMDRFGGLPMENPSKYLNSFIEKCSTLRINGLDEEAIRLKLFSFSLKDGAKEWLEGHEPNFFTTWDALAKAFITRYFPP